MLGCSFHVLGKNDGRLMLVCQSTCVSNVSPYRTRRTPPVLSAGVRLIVGNVCEMLSFERSWERLPPILSAPHENCFAKFKFDAMVDLTSHGLSEFRWMTDPLVA